MPDTFEQSAIKLNKAHLALNLHEIKLVQWLYNQSPSGGALEVGTFMGQTAWALWQTRPESWVVTLERQASYQELILHNWQQALGGIKGLQKSVSFLGPHPLAQLPSGITFQIKSEDTSGLVLGVGMALEYLKQCSASLFNYFSFAFVDANKGGYLEYFDLLYEKLPQGAILVFDNIFLNHQLKNEFLKKIPLERQGVQAIATLFPKASRDELEDLLDKVTGEPFTATTFLPSPNWSENVKHKLRTLVDKVQHLELYALVDGGDGFLIIKKNEDISHRLSQGAT